MFKLIGDVIRKYKVKKMEKAAEIKGLQIKEQIKKLYTLVAIIEKGYCKDRTAKRQFRRDITSRGFIHATLLKQFLVQRGALDIVLKMNPIKDAQKQYRLIKKLKRKNKISKATRKELLTNANPKAGKKVA